MGPRDDTGADVDPLTALADEFGADKGSTGHRYTEHYHRHLAPMRESARHVLEIGIGVAHKGPAGKSLRMWKGYFPHAVVDGVDIRPVFEVAEDRIVPHQLDAADPVAFGAFLEGREYDVIVDDGSHRVPHQLASLACAFPVLRPGGIYIMEDVIPADGVVDRRDGLTHLGPEPSKFNPTGTMLVPEALFRRFLEDGTLPSELLSPTDRGYLERHIASVAVHPGRKWSNTVVLHKREPGTA